MKIRLRRTLALGASIPLVFAVAACGSNTSTESTPTPTATTSATDTLSPSPSVTATSAPTDATGTPSPPIEPLVLSVSATTAKPGERINVTVSGPKSMAGRQVAIVDMIAPDKYQIFSKLALNDQGQATGYLVLGVNDAVQAFVPTVAVTDNHWTTGQPILAASGLINITVQ